MLRIGVHDICGASRLTLLVQLRTHEPGFLLAANSSRQYPDQLYG